MSLPVDFAQDLWVRKTFSVAGHTLLVYDYLLTLDDEIKYIWNSSWTVVKVMFLLNRYGNLFGQTYLRLEEAGLLTNNSQSFCRSFALITTIFMLISSETIHILVLMRARAVWGTREKGTKILAWSYVIYCFVQLGGAMWSLNRKNISYYFRYLELSNVCVGDMPKYAWLSYFGSFILNTILFILTIKNLRKHAKEFRDLYPFGLLHVLVRDAICFFIISIFSDVLTIVSWTVYSSSPKYLLPKGFANPLLSVAGQRLVLNLRGLKMRSYSTRDLSLEVDRQLQAIREADDHEAEVVLANGLEDGRGVT